MAYETLIPFLRRNRYHPHQPAQGLECRQYAAPDELMLVLDEMEINPEVKAIIITGGDKGIGAGADLKTFVTYGVFDAFDSSTRYIKQSSSIEDSNKR
jgi:enoyl-CoA hydratase/carnithine racemase